MLQESVGSHTAAGRPSLKTLHHGPTSLQGPCVCALPIRARKQLQASVQVCRLSTVSSSASRVLPPVCSGPTRPGSAYPPVMFPASLCEPCKGLGRRHTKHASTRVQELIAVPLTGSRADQGGNAVHTAILGLAEKQEPDRWNSQVPASMAEQTPCSSPGLAALASCPPEQPLTQAPFPPAQQRPTATPT